MNVYLMVGLMVFMNVIRDWNWVWEPRKFGAIGDEVEGELQVSGLWIGGCIFGF